MILPATVPVGTPLPISIVPSQPVVTESQPEPAVVTPIKKGVPNIVPPGILRISHRTIHVPDRLNL